MLGRGTLTLVDTSTNTVISDATAHVSNEYPEVHAFDVFEFTVPCVIVLITGTVYRVCRTDRCRRWVRPRLRYCVENYATIGMNDADRTPYLNRSVLPVI